jgi:hypothetical protein
MTTHPSPEGQPEQPRLGARRRRRSPLIRAVLAGACLASAGAMTLAATGIASASPVRPAQSGTPYFVTGNGGYGQSATTRSPFQEPLKVLVYDQNGHPSADATVTFRIHGGQGNLTGTAAFPGGAQSADVVTGADGGAASPVLTAGTDVGYLQVVASVPGASQSATFDLHVGYSPAAQVNIVSGDGQSALAGTGFAHPLVVQVLDAHGYPVQDGSQVTFQIEPAGPNPGTAHFPDGTTTARAGVRAGDGYATSPAITAGSRPGPFQVIAEVTESPATPRAVFTGTSLPQAATTAEITGGNYQFGSAGSVFPAPLQVRILDQAGHPIPDPAAGVTVTGPATIYGRTTLNVQGDSDGVISMPLAAADDSGPVTVTVTTGTATATFYEDIPGRGTVTITPLGGGNQQANPGQPFPARLGVLVHDGDARVIPSFPVTFTVHGPAVFADGSKSATISSSADDITYAPPLQATFQPGAVTVTVTIAGSDASAQFHLQVNEVRGLVIRDGDRQTTLASSDPAHLDPFPAGLWVEATYPADGQPANGVTVTYTIHGTAAVFVDFNNNHRDTATAVTGAVYPGQAAAVLCAGYNVAGTVTITATAPGYGSVSFTETVVKR